MGFEATRVAVGTTATPLTGLSAPEAFNSIAKTLVKNIGVVAVYVGGSGVTTSTGFALAPNEFITVEYKGSPLYGIVASGSVNVSVLESGAGIA